MYQIIRIDGDRLHYEAKTAGGTLHDVFELRKRSNGTNRLVERPQLEAEGRGGWSRSGLLAAVPVAVLVGLTAVITILRRPRASVANRV